MAFIFKHEGREEQRRPQAAHSEDHQSAVDKHEQQDDRQQVGDLTPKTFFRGIRFDTAGESNLPTFRAYQMDTLYLDPVNRIFLFM